MTAHWPVAAGGVYLVKLQAQKRGKCCQKGHGGGNTPTAGDRNQICRERFNGGVTLPLFRDAMGALTRSALYGAERVWEGKQIRVEKMYRETIS